MDAWAPDGDPDRNLRGWASPMLSNASSKAQRIIDNNAAILKVFQEGVDMLKAEVAKKEGPYRLHEYTAYTVAAPPELRIKTHPHLSCLKKNLPYAYTSQWTDDKADVVTLLAQAQAHLAFTRSQTEELEGLLFDRSNPQYVGDRLPSDVWMKTEIDSVAPISAWDSFQHTCEMVKKVVNDTGVSLEDLGLLWMTVGAAEDPSLSKKADFLPTLTRILDQYKIPATVECLPFRSSLVHSAAENGLVDVCRFLFLRIQEEEEAAAMEADQRGRKKKGGSDDMSSKVLRADAPLLDDIESGEAAVDALFEAAFAEASEELGTSGAGDAQGSSAAAAAAAAAAAEEGGGAAETTSLTSILTRSNRFGDTLLIGCIREGQLEVVRLLLSEFATPEQVQTFINLTNKSKKSI